MSRIRKCPTCDNEIDINANPCPKCGKKFTTLFTKLIAVMFGIPFIISIFAAATTDTSTTDTYYRTPVKKVEPVEPVELPTKIKAIMACQDRYENSARYDVDLPWLSTTTKEMGKTWIVQMDGKMQNGFGAWQKALGHCVYDKDQQEIIAFEVN